MYPDLFLERWSWKSQTAYMLCSTDKENCFTNSSRTVNTCQSEELNVSNYYCLSNGLMTVVTAIFADIPFNLDAT